MEELEFIGESEIKNRTPYEKLINIIEEAFVAYDNGNVEMPDKSYVMVDDHNGDFRSMPAYINTPNWEASGVKWVNVHPDNTELDTVMGTLIYTDPKTGEPLATMDGTEITKRRTATVAAIATDYLAVNNVENLGILGAGVQSYEQVRAIEEVRDFNRILVSDVRDEAISRFKETFDNYNVVSVDPKGVTDVDVLCTTTPVEDPVISSIENENIHINAMGADAPDKQEIETDLTTSDDMNIFVDSYSQAMHSGEISVPVSQGQIQEDDIYGNLGEVVNKSIELNDIKQDKTLFDSTGLAIQDISTAYLVYNEELDI